jgi:hypothetical protein
MVYIQKMLCNGIVVVLCFGINEEPTRSKKRSYKKQKNKSQTFEIVGKKPAVKHQILLNRACIKYDKTIWDGKR